MPFADSSLDRVIAAIPPRQFRGRVWRVHWREVAADDWDLSLRTSGRYHRGLDLFPRDQTFFVLCTSLATEIAIWEMVRRSASRNLGYLKNNVLTEFDVQLDRGLDLSHPGSVGLNLADLTGPDLRPCQALAAAARSLGFDGLVVPSAALPGLNLIILPHKIADPERLRVVGSGELPIDLGSIESAADAPIQGR